MFYGVLSEGACGLWLVVLVLLVVAVVVVVVVVVVGGGGYYPMRINNASHQM